MLSRVKLATTWTISYASTILLALLDKYQPLWVPIKLVYPNMDWLVRGKSIAFKTIVKLYFLENFRL